MMCVAGVQGVFAGERILWMDNTTGLSGQDVQVEAKQLRISIKFFFANATDRAQAAHCFPPQR